MTESYTMALHAFLFSCIVTAILGETMTAYNITNGDLECTLPGVCTIDCRIGDPSNKWHCHSTNLTCLDGYDCLIICGVSDCGKAYSANSRIKCPDGGNCVINADNFAHTPVYCPPSDHACTVTQRIGQGMLLIGGGGDLSYTGSAIDYDGISIIECPVNKMCTIHCTGEFNKNHGESCSETRVDARYAAQLDLGGNGITNGTIYCPQSNVRGNTNTCNIEMAYTNGLSGVLIHAIEGYNDINLSCKD
eukprot:605164_1